MIGGFSIGPLARLSTPAGFFKLTRAGLVGALGLYALGRSWLTAIASSWPTV